MQRGRPRLHPEGEPETELHNAPDTSELNEYGYPPLKPPVYTPPAHVPPPPPVKKVERMGSRSEPYTRRYPQVRGGICEYCGVIDRNYPSTEQYKLCPHFRGMELRCSYCPEEKDPADVVYHAVLNIAEHPDNPNKLVVWCDSYTCSAKHLKRFQLSS